jgi:protein O-mannosyl-transferase
MDVFKKDHVVCWSLFIVTIIVYANTLLNGFVTDDPGVILHNPVMQQAPLSLFSAIDTNSDTQLLPFYRPLTYLTFLIEGRAHGFNPRYMHLINVLLHAINVMLVYRLARSLFDDQWPAIIVGFLFAVHPIQSEGVNFLSGGRNTMLACMLALMTYAVHRQCIAKRNIVYAVIGAFLLFAGACSKELALMILPFILWLEMLDVRGQNHENRRASLVRLMPYVVAVACYLLLRWLTLSKLGIQESIIPGSTADKMKTLYDIPGLKERLLNNIYILPRYLVCILWPTALSPGYAIPADFRALAPQLIAGWVCILGILVWVLNYARSRATLFGLAWIVIFWLPVSGLVYFSIIEMADRYIYLPAIGVWILIADQMTRLIHRGTSVTRYATMGMVLVTVLLGILTVRRNSDWQSDMSLFTRMVEQYPNNAYGLNHLGAAQLRSNGPTDLDAAEMNLSKSLALAPTTEFVQPLLGYIRLERGDLGGAVKYLSEALRIQPNDREARINRGITYEKMGRFNEAVTDYEYYLKISDSNDLPGSQEYALERVQALTSGRSAQ